MHETINSNDASNEQLTRLRNIVWLWCISEGYEDVSTGESICFTKNQTTTTFILETNKSRDELLTCIYEATEKYDYIFVVINDSSKRRELIKNIPEFCGVFCDSNAFGLGQVTQIFRFPSDCHKKRISIIKRFKSLFIRN
jgi:hypothetical protein